MLKTIIVINGAGGVGKDTLCNIAARHFAVWNISSITPIKELATVCGWQGEKTDKARKFLADLKQLTIEYSDYPLRWLMNKCEEFYASDATVLFVHIREPKEIQKFVEATNGKALTLLIEGSEYFLSKRAGQAYGNAADDDVANYNYDYYYKNEYSLKETEEIFPRFLRKVLKENAK